MRMVMAVVMIVMRMLVRSRAQRVSPRRQRIHPGPFEGILRLQKIRINGQRTLEIECADVKHIGHRHVGILRAMDAGRAVHGANATLDAFEFGFGDEVGFVEQDHVGKRDLLARLFHFVEVPLDVARIDERDDGVEQKLIFELVVEEKGLRHRTRIGHPGGLDDDVIELVASFEQLPEDAQQVAAHRAADAAVVGFEDLLFGTDDELVVDTDLAELVFDHRDTLTVVFGEDAIEERGFSRPQKSRQDGDGHPFRVCHRVDMIT